MFYKFNQNNSGGAFKKIKGRHAAYVVVEASSKEEASERAKSIGVYFDGCKNGMDCSCCGNRWRPTEDYDALKTGFPWAIVPKDVGDSVVYFSNGETASFIYYSRPEDSFMRKMVMG